MWASVVMLNGNLIGLIRWRDRSVVKVKFQSNFEGRPETGEPLPSNANCWDSVLAILPGWTRACVLFCNTWHIACYYSLSWWTSLVCLSSVDMKKMQALMWCKIWFFQQPSRVLLCLFLNEVSWQATRKVVPCWTKRQTYCCAKHLFRLKAPWPWVLQESKCLPYCGAKHKAGRLGEYSMMQYDSYLKKPWTPWDNAFPECLQDCLYMFMKMILIGLPSSWTCGLCRACWLGFLLDLCDAKQWLYHDWKEESFAGISSWNCSNGWVCIESNTCCDLWCQLLWLTLKSR